MYRSEAKPPGTGRVSRARRLPPTIRLSLPISTSTFPLQRQPHTGSRNCLDSPALIQPQIAASAEPSARSTQETESKFTSPGWHMFMPHPIPYQGSKRRLASIILAYAPQKIDRLIEPFAGSAAITLAAAARKMAKRYVIGDSLQALVNIWHAVLHDPEHLADEYGRIWRAQGINPAEHYLKIRNTFNHCSPDNPAQLLFLLARCVKNAVRFNRAGQFNQSADHRRRGVNPGQMRVEILQAHQLLDKHSEAICADYGEVLEQATSKDFVYLDPPYQGVAGRDPRYFQQLDFERLVKNLERLNCRHVPYLLSFDGMCGAREYGQEMPKDLKLSRILVHTGRSSQATLNGRNEDTIESLYLSPGLGSGPTTKSILVRTTLKIEAKGQTLSRWSEYNS